MSVKIKINWDNENVVSESVRIYRSDSTFTPTSLPPILTEIIDDVYEYEDFDVIESQTYFYMLSSKLGDYEVFTECYEVTASSINYVINSKFELDLFDECGVVWSKVGNPQISGGFLNFTNGNYVESAGSNAFHFDNSQDVIIEFDLKSKIVPPDRYVIITTRNFEAVASRTNGYALYVLSTGRLALSMWNNNASVSVFDLLSPTGSIQFDDTINSVKVERKNMNWTVKVNNVLLHTQMQSLNYLSNLAKLRLGTERYTDPSVVGNTARDLVGSLRHLSIIID